MSANLIPGSQTAAGQAAETAPASASTSIPTTESILQSANAAMVQAQAEAPPAGVAPPVDPAADPLADDFEGDAADSAVGRDPEVSALIDQQQQMMAALNALVERLGSAMPAAAAAGVAAVPATPPPAPGGGASRMHALAKVTLGDGVPDVMVTQYVDLLGLYAGWEPHLRAPDPELQSKAQAQLQKIDMQLNQLEAQATLHKRMADFEARQNAPVEVAQGRGEIAPQHMEAIHGLLKQPAKVAKHHPAMARAIKANPALADQIFQQLDPKQGVEALDARLAAMESGFALAVTMSSAPGAAPALTAPPAPGGVQAAPVKHISNPAAVMPVPNTPQAAPTGRDPSKVPTRDDILAEARRRMALHGAAN